MNHSPTTTMMPKMRGTRTVVSRRIILAGVSQEEGGAEAAEAASVEDAKGGDGT